MTDQNFINRFFDIQTHVQKTLFQAATTDPTLNSTLEHLSGAYLEGFKAIEDKMPKLSRTNAAVIVGLLNHLPSSIAAIIPNGDHQPTHQNLLKIMQSYKALANDIATEFGVTNLREGHAAYTGQQENTLTAYRR